MRSVRSVLAGVVAAVSFLVVPSAAPAVVVAGGPARDALVRLVGQRYADQVVLQTLDRGSGKDFFASGPSAARC